MQQMVVMQDLSCFGKCSLSVILPVVSAMGVACAPLPTAVLSTHTAYPGPVVADLSDFARQTMDHWKTLDLRFDGILTGYLADPDQVALARQLRTEFAGPDTKVITDPAMADHGKRYSGLPETMVPAMLELCREADLCLPNLTEGALMTGIPWEDRADPDYCRRIARGLLELGCRAVMLTGAEPEPGKIGFFFTDGTKEVCEGIEKRPRSCHGTGDLFAAVTAGAVTRGLSPEEGGRLAMELIARSIDLAPADSRSGVPFENGLEDLAARTRMLCK